MYQYPTVRQVAAGSAHAAHTRQGCAAHAGQHVGTCAACQRASKAAAAANLYAANMARRQAAQRWQARA